MDIFRLIDLVTSDSFSRGRFEEIFGKKMTPVPSNRFYERFLLDLAVVDGLVLRKLDLRLRRGPDAGPSLVNMCIDDQPCVSLDSIRKYHPDLVLGAVPTGRSPQERIVYEGTVRGAKVRFGLSDDSGCLVQLSLEASE